MKRSKPSNGTVGGLIDLYRQSPEFIRLSYKTKQSYEYAFRIGQQAIGGCPLAQFSKAVFRSFLDGFADRPATQKIVRSAFVTLETWGLQRDYLEHPMMYLVKVKGGDGAREPWTDEEVELAIRHAKPELAKVVTLARWSGQRAGDLVAMQWQHIKRDDEGGFYIEVRQQKTGLDLWVPVVPQLEAALDTWGRSLGYILTKADGSPWTRQQLSSAFGHERDTNPALEPLRAKKLSLHGLRASAVIDLRRAGFTDADVAAFIGMSVKMVSRYGRKAVAYISARKAMRRTGMEQNNVVALKRKGETDG